MYDRAVGARLTHPTDNSDLDLEMAEPGLLLNLLGHHQRLGVWRLEIPSGQLFWSKRVFEIYGFEYRQGPVDPSLALQCLVPEDRKAAGEIMIRAIQQKSNFEHIAHHDRHRGVPGHRNRRWNGINRDRGSARGVWNHPRCDGSGGGG